MTTDLVELGRRGGIVLRREAIAMGMNDRTIAALVSSEQWHRVRRGAYVAGDVWNSLDPLGQHRVLARAVLATAECPAALSHISAAVEHGAEVWDVDLSQVHITRLDGRAGRHEAGVHQHCGRLDQVDLHVHDGISVVSPARAVVEVTTMTDVERGLVVVNSLIHERPDVLERAMVLAGVMDHWQNTLRTRIVLRLADSRIESVAESRTCHLLWSHGLPYFHPQYKIRDGAGRVVARVDFALPELGVFLEVDGRVKYLQRRGNKSLEQVLLEEREREKLICRLTGWVCIRVTWADLANPARLAREIQAIIESRRTNAG